MVTDWIQHNGEDDILADDYTPVDVLFRDGTVLSAFANVHSWNTINSFVWVHSGAPSDVVAYRLRPFQESDWVPCTNNRYPLGDTDIHIIVKLREGQIPDFSRRAFMWRWGNTNDTSDIVACMPLPPVQREIDYV